jgi:hypothetical protein
MVLYSLELWEPLYCDTTTEERIEKFYKNFIEMGWYRAHRSFNQEPEIIDNCLFCGSHKKIKRTDFTIVFSEYEYNTGNICVDCYSANARRVYLG